MSDSVNIFLQQLLISSKAGTAANISERCAYLSFDIIGQLAFGHMFNTQTEDTNRFISSTFHTLVWRINTVMQQPLLRIPQFIAIMLDLKAFKKLQLAIRGVLDERLAKEKDEIHDFYSIASKEGNFGPEFFRTKMWPESANFLIAGKLPFSRAFTDRLTSPSSLSRWNYTYSYHVVRIFLSLTVSRLLRPSCRRNSISFLIW